MPFIPEFQEGELNGLDPFDAMYLLHLDERPMSEIYAALEKYKQNGFDPRQYK